MQLARAQDFSAVLAAPLFLSDEPASAPRLRCHALPPEDLYGSDSVLTSGDECPRFSVDVLDGDVLQLTLPGQSLPDNRGFISPHTVLGRLRGATLELELYGAGPRRLHRGHYIRRPRFVSVGVWSIGEYVLWRGERHLDFIVLDAIDLCLRKQLPPGGGISTIKRLDILASAAGVSFRA